MSDQRDDRLELTLSDAERRFYEISERIAKKGTRAQVLALAEEAIRAHPTAAGFLSLGALAALLEGKPARALTLLKRIDKRSFPNRDDHLYRAFALAQQGRWPQASKILEQHHLNRTEGCPDNAFTLRYPRAVLLGCLRWSSPSRRVRFRRMRQRDRQTVHRD